LVGAATTHAAVLQERRRFVGWMKTIVDLMRI